ncbi:MAG: response regulator, partial [Spirochaetales bacterium]
KRLEEHGAVELAVNGVEAIDAVTNRLKDGKTYDLICLDIMLPGMDGQEALKRIRAAEASAGYAVGQGSKIVMTTALSDANNVMSAFRGEADGYLVKPIERDKLEQQLNALGLLSK